MTKKEFLNYIDKRFDEVLERLCPSSNAESKKQVTNKKTSKK